MAYRARNRVKDAPTLHYKCLMTAMTTTDEGGYSSSCYSRVCIYQFELNHKPIRKRHDVVVTKE